MRRTEPVQQFPFIVGRITAKAAETNDGRFAAEADAEEPDSVVSPVLQSGLDRFLRRLAVDDGTVPKIAAHIGVGPQGMQRVDIVHATGAQAEAAGFENHAGVAEHISDGCPVEERTADHTSLAGLTRRL